MSHSQAWFLVIEVGVIAVIMFIQAIR